MLDQKRRIGSGSRRGLLRFLLIWGWINSHKIMEEKRWM